MCTLVTGVTDFGYCCDNAGCAHDVVLVRIWKELLQKKAELSVKTLIVLCSSVSPWERKGFVLIVECYLC